jgi:hypothetical protein
VAASPEKIRGQRKKTAYLFEKMGYENNCTEIISHSFDSDY